MSIEENNKLRAKLGLAPLQIDEPTTSASSGDSKHPPILEAGEKLFTEDGVKIVHKVPNNWAHEKQNAKISENLETHKQKRQIESKVLKVRKTLAESDDDEDSTAAWIERNRRLEKERKKAEQKVLKIFNKRNYIIFLINIVFFLLKKT